MKDKKKKNPRLGKVGGQAVLEGIMMKSGDRISLAVREDDGDIAVKNSVSVSLRKKNKILNLPIIRGCINFVETLVMSYTTLEDSAKMLGMDEIDEETKFDKWIKEKFGDKIMNVVMALAAVIGVALALFLFTFLPALITKWLNSLTENGLGWWQNLISGGIRICIFVVYMALVSLMKDIRRTFEYHGAEHKSIACYEAGEELTPSNAKKYTRFHPRCGTSFIFVILIISILIFSVVKWDTNIFVMIGLRLCLLPVVVGISYEFLMLTGKHPNKFTLILAYPGLLMQRITTKEPDEKQLEVAIAALKCALKDEFPETYDYYENKSKEKRTNDGKTECEYSVHDEMRDNADGNKAQDEANVVIGENETQNKTLSEEQSEADGNEKAEGISGTDVSEICGHDAANN